MINELFEFYKKELTFSSLVTKDNRKISNLILFVGGILLITFWYLFITHNQFLWTVGGILVVVISFYLLIYLNGKTVKNKFPEMYISTFKWSSNKFNDLFLEKLGEKIKNESELNLDLIQKQIKEKENKEKTSSVIIFTLFGALFIPLWSTYIAALMDTYKENSQIMTFNFLSITFLIFIISFFGYMFLDIRDNLLSDFQKWNKLNNLITEYRIRKNRSET
ncbi:hypothetical protein [Arenibacter certesii]|uniref:Uncharacterized protein n=1 Tax=Arenibacter certesii TaxID=228955 RepID=A0A918J5Q2_9FLAO|nr:hypothetical protein [Arenibacter certesii]GGW48690.1 hypothetical protein GCM10007383_35900 [Arenibacter certesii]